MKSAVPKYSKRDSRQRLGSEPFPSGRSSPSGQRRSTQSGSARTRAPRTETGSYASARITSLVVDSLASALALILKFDGPSDVLLSRFFRLHPSLGQRDRGLIAEAVFFALRRYASLAWLMRPAYPARAARFAALLTLARQHGVDAIDQRALFLPTDAGNILWECLSLVTDDAVAALKAKGAVDRIIISHPHFYAAMVEWSEALGGVPILLHEADKAWVQRPSPRIEFWGGDSKRLSDAVTLIRCGGHFTGSTAIHWRDGPRKGGALFPGDALQVVMDRRHVTFMYSYPNYVPMKTSDVQAMRARLAGYAFEDVYRFTWGRLIIGGGKEAVDRSFDRFLGAVAA